MFAKNNERGMSSKYREQMKKGLNPKTKKKEKKNDKSPAAEFTNETSGTEVKKKLNFVNVISNILNTIFTIVIFLVIFLLLAYILYIILQNTGSTSGMPSIQDFVESIKNMFS